MGLGPISRTFLLSLNCWLSAKKSNRNEAMSIVFYENSTLHQKPGCAEKLMEVITSKYRLLLHIHLAVPRRGNCRTIVLPHTTQEIIEPTHKP